MNELVVEGLEVEDFTVLKKILETYSVTLNGPVTFRDVENLHIKIKQIVDYLETE